MLMIAPGPPMAALDEAGARLDVLLEREWGDYFQLGGDHIHSWRVEHADPDDPGNVPGVEWCERVPLPLASQLLTAAYVSPAPRVYFSPLEREEAPDWASWVRRMNRNVERGARSGGCVVVADFHC